MELKVAMLTGHSLFADGLASKLSEYSNSFELRVFDDRPDGLKALAAFQPFAVILEDNETQPVRTWSLQQLLGILPGLMIIFLNIGQSKITVIRGEQYAANGASELMAIIQQSRQSPAHEFA
jgi:hypothetical protein